jgi:hypothetical protein
MSRKWYIVLTFILGMAFGELSSDFTDWIYFTHFKDITFETAPIYWYFLTASWYAILFFIAYFISKTGIITPESFIYFMMFLAILGAYLSWNALSKGASPLYLFFVLGIPTMVSLGILEGVRRQVD